MEEQVQAQTFEVNENIIEANGFYVSEFQLFTNAEITEEDYDPDFDDYSANIELIRYFEAHPDAILCNIIHNSTDWTVVDPSTTPWTVVAAYTFSADA